jgi:hypothetical protein
MEGSLMGGSSSSGSPDEVLFRGGLSDRRVWDLRKFQGLSYGGVSLMGGSPAKNDRTSPKNDRNGM